MALFCDDVPLRNYSLTVRSFDAFIDWCVRTEHSAGRVPWTSPAVHGEGAAWCLETDPARRTHCWHRWFSQLCSL